MEHAHYEAALNGHVHEFPFCDIGKRDLSDIFRKVSHSGNSLLHVAASCGHQEITELVARHYPFLITMKNSQEDNPLHVATKAGRLSTAMVLVDCAKQFASTSGSDDGALLLLKMVNNKGNTALHEALVAIQCSMADTADEESKKSLDSAVAMARYLVSSDPTVSYWKNNRGKSPLCLAVESGNLDILEYLLRALHRGDGDNMNWAGGKSPAHVAIEQRKLDALRLIKRETPDLLLLGDENGNTPLHYAASRGYVDGVVCLLEYGAFLKNNKGFYPIHLACKNGDDDCEVMKELLKKWPDPTDFLTNKGRNILHIAAKRGKIDAVRYILQETNMKKAVNEMDNDGNTPLHLAVFHGHYLLVYILLREYGVNADLTNNQGLGPYDIAVNQYDQTLDMEIYKKQDRPRKNPQVDGEFDFDESSKVSTGFKSSKEPDKMEALNTLSILYIILKHRHKKRFNTPMETPRIRGNPNPEVIQNSINNLLVAATVIMGAAFAASIQMPSLKEGGPGPGHFTYFMWSVFDLDLSWTSKIFVLCNTSAMNLSVLAALMLCWAQVVRSNIASSIISIVYGIVGIAIFMLSQAFWCALHINVKDGTIPSRVLGAFSIACELPQVLILATLTLIPLRTNEVAFLYSAFLAVCVPYEIDRLAKSISQRERRAIKLSAN